MIYEDNTVEYNAGTGIFSRDFLRGGNPQTTAPERRRGPLWFWGPEIQVAASQNVEVYGNTMTVRPNGRAIMLIDEIASSRPGATTTQSNSVHHNDIAFLGAG